MSRRFVASAVLLLVVLGSGAALAAKKHASIQESVAAAASQPEPMEMVSPWPRPPARLPGLGDRRRPPCSPPARSPSATRLAGTVRQVALAGRVVPAGTVLVALDVSVERAELQAQKARAALAETLLQRNQQATRTTPSPTWRWTAPAPSGALRRGGAHGGDHRPQDDAPLPRPASAWPTCVGQYLNEGTVLTTLQGIDDVAHVDFAVPQRAPPACAPGDRVDISEERRPRYAGDGGGRGRPGGSTAMPCAPHRRRTAPPTPPSGVSVPRRPGPPPWPSR